MLKTTAPIRACAAVTVFACWATAASAEVRLNCPEHTRLEAKEFRQGIRAHCVLGDGTRHGPWGGWYPSGQRAIAGHYENGELHGVETEWFDKSKLSGWQGFRARFRAAKRYRNEFSRGKLHGKVTEWDINGRMLAQSTWHEGQFVSYRRSKASAARDAELGRPFAAAKKPKGCFSSERFPSLLQTMMGEPADGYSGYRVLYGTNKNCVREKLPCRSYSRAQLGDIMGHAIAGYSDAARFAVVACRTDEDQRTAVAAAEQTWRARSAAHHDPGVVALLAKLQGTWCGRSTRVQQDHEWHREIRLEFVDGDPELIAHATDTWNRVPGGPMGEPGYVMRSVLIPMPRSTGKAPTTSQQPATPATQMHFKAVSVHSNVGGYRLAMETDGPVITHSGRRYLMTQNCAGFWAPEKLADVQQP